MSTLWSSVFSSGTSGGVGLIMPEMYTKIANDLKIKDGLGTIWSSDNAGFWTALALSQTEKGFDTAVFSAAADTTEQEIMNESGSGVLTSVLAPALSASGTMTIRVTADGELTTFVSQIITGANTARYGVGSYMLYNGTIIASAVGYGSGLDSGFGSEPKSVLPTPTQSLQIGGIGIKFNSTCVVTIQGSVNITATAQMLKAYAGWSLSIPKGL